MFSEKQANVFFEVYSNLPREGPGDNQSTRKAYLTIEGIPENPRILDIGCGSGMQTIEIAKISQGQVIALDNHQPFLEELRKNAEKEGVSQRIKAVFGDMLALDYPRNSFDLVWSEGAIYIIGFEKGLKEWKKYLTKTGFIVVSELSWTRSDAPEELKKTMRELYPAIKTIDENVNIAKKIGYNQLATFILPKESWFDNYYNPIKKKLPYLRNKYKNDKEALKIILCSQVEIELYQKYSDYYGYVFYILSL